MRENVVLSGSVSLVVEESVSEMLILLELRLTEHEEVSDKMEEDGWTDSCSSSQVFLTDSDTVGVFSDKLDEFSSWEEFSLSSRSDIAVFSEWFLASLSQKFAFDILPAARHAQLIRYKPYD